MNLNYLMLEKMLFYITNIRYCHAKVEEIHLLNK